MPRWGKIVLGLLAIALAVGLGGYGIYDWVQDRNNAKAQFIGAAQKLNYPGKLTVEWGEGAEADYMEIVLKAGVKNCLIEIEAHKNKPASFWLDEVHTPRRIGGPTEDDVPQAMAAQRRPTYAAAQQHIRDNKRNYDCAA